MSGSPPARRPRYLNRSKGVPLFLNLLMPAQQELFMQAAHLVAAQDGEVDELETALLEALGAESELESLPGAVELANALGRAPDVLTDGPSRRAFLLELAGVVVIDGEAHPAEVSRLREFADALDVPETQVDRFLDYALQARSFVDTGRTLIATADGEG